MPDKKLTDKWLEEIREKISCPQLGDEHYGEWGILTKHQRFTIKRMLDFIESQEAYINRLQAENEKLKRESDVSIEDIHSLSDRVNELIEENEELKSAINGFRGYEDKIKAEAYKEFAEKIKQKTLAMIYSTDEISTDDYIECIDDVVKELEGETDEKTIPKQSND